MKRLFKLNVILTQDFSLNQTFFSMAVHLLAFSEICEINNNLKVSFSNPTKASADKQDARCFRVIVGLTVQKKLINLRIEYWFVLSGSFKTDWCKTRLVFIQIKHCLIDSHLKNQER